MSNPKWIMEQSFVQAERRTCRVHDVAITAAIFAKVQDLQSI